MRPLGIYLGVRFGRNRSARNVGVTPGETSEARNVGVSPGEKELAQKTVIPQTNILNVILLDYLCILGLSATRWRCSPTV